MRGNPVQGVFLCLLVVIHIAQSTNAKQIITPTAATSTTTIGGTRTIDKTIDGSDLSPGGPQMIHVEMIEVERDLRARCVRVEGMSCPWGVRRGFLWTAYAQSTVQACPEVPLHL